MAWTMVAMAAVSAAGSIASANSASAQNENQAAWNKYNAEMGYLNDQANLKSQATLGMFNASMEMKAAEMNAQATLDVAKFNADQVRATTEYNNLLLDEEARLLWEAEGLDQEMLASQRLRERSEIIASQASSGTTIGDGSNQNVVDAQRSEELMDAFIIRHNADIGASKIRNAQAQGQWQGDMQIQKIMYEGEMGAAMMQENARLSAAGTMFETAVGYDAGSRSASYKRDAGLSGADQAFSSNQAQIDSNLTSGLFSAAAQAGSSYYNGKTVLPDQSYGSYDSTINSVSKSAVQSSNSNSSLGSLMLGSSSNSSIMGA